MVEVGRFVDGLKAAGIGLFAGMPDSQLKSFCAHVTDTCGESHVIAANEVGAVGLAAAHYNVNTVVIESEPVVSRRVL